ncbi:hypothetical protein CEXT_489941 [Caerostris extrusa]|uniref:Uncharacterized protein n=1 Tax=Caerostris extrusa TaxID=172846 RepID=A0AAV4W8D8_CAEEX|nr:hypothetical protein CEXT_489941 [Caerostris extrusa]
MAQTRQQTYCFKCKWASKMQGKVLNNMGRSVSRKSSSASRKDVIKMLVCGFNTPPQMVNISIYGLLSMSMKELCLNDPEKPPN